MKMTQLKDIRRDCHATLSPIRRLPAEVLVKILRWTPKSNIELRDTPDNYQSFFVHGFNVFKISEGPWYLGQVCSSWRYIVWFLCPETWSRIKIGCPLNPEDIRIPAPGKGMIALLNQVLERGHNHCLDFFFISYRHAMDDPEELVEPQEVIQCFDLLLTHSEHWGCVELEIDPFYMPRLSQVRGRVNQLEELNLMCIPDAMPGNMDAFEIAPKLRTLEFGGMHAEADTPFPKENLSFFSDARPVLGHHTVRKYLDIIASAPRLTTFFYFHYDSTIPESPSEHHPQIVHQSLRTLSTALGPLIDSLTLPGLLWLTAQSRMRFGGAFDCPEDTVSRIYHLVVRSECSLTSLSFVGEIMDENLLPLLRLIPRLISLSFEWYDPVPSEESDAAMRSVFLDMSKTVRVGDGIQHTLLPRLEVLELKIFLVEFETVEFLDAGLVEMVASRCIPVDSRVLEMLRINVHGRGFHVPFIINDSDFGLEKLKSFQDHGLELDLDLDDLEDHSSLEGMYSSESEDDD
ncbi:hypothetical protein EDD18DRAFT_1200846 [Armillaria luteobubalina]|uniref:F-box domain-containing protein n=1 Tax=Armillaria luteobubalina TaxID=153913 RepID=A0AA39PFC9_9AGAR|nr:hypothetical protein EDD18DRAFT_1200846 [Armillaria luteobubalina]